MNLLKQTKKTAADEARKVAKQIRQEPLELAKTIIPPHIIEGAKKEGDQQSIVAEMVESGHSQPREPVNEEEVRTQTNKRLEELEGEIRKIREERKAKEEEWKKAQEEMSKPPDASEQPFVMPQGKKKQGFMGFAKKKQGTKEMGKQMSG